MDFSNAMFHPGGQSLKPPVPQPGPPDSAVFSPSSTGALESTTPCNLDHHPTCRVDSGLPLCCVSLSPSHTHGSKQLPALWEHPTCTRHHSTNRSPTQGPHRGLYCIAQIIAALFPSPLLLLFCLFLFCGHTQQCLSYSWLCVQESWWFSGDPMGC